MQNIQVLAGNWKMHKTQQDVRTFFEEIKKRAAWPTTAPLKCIVAASPTLLATCVEAAKGSGVEIYAQNCSWEEQGAFTGESSAAQILDVGAHGTLVGHSERRTLFGDTDESCGKRAAKALSSGLDVIYCVGESLQERDAGETQSLLAKQLTTFVNHCSGFKNTFQKTRLRVAYEPIWAIGTGRVASPQQVAEAHAFIAGFLKERGLPCPILYGGSVKPSNFGELAALPNVYGALVGGASLAPDDYTNLRRVLETTPLKS